MIIFLFLILSEYGFSMVIDKEKDINFDIKEIDEIMNKGGKYFLDIGCGIGLYSLYALSKGMNVICFEPVLEDLEVLVISLELNPQFLDKIIIYEFGLSDILKDSKDNYRLAPIDSFLNELPHFDLIKMNSYNSDEIFQGGEKFFSIHKNIPILLISTPMKDYL